MQNANECINQIVKLLKKEKIVVNKNYEKKVKTTDSAHRD